MKKYLSFMAFAMVAVFSLAFVSCGDDDEDEDEPSSSISDFVGTWSVQSVEGWGNDLDDSYYEYMQLKADGSYINVQEDEDEVKGYIVYYGKWSVSNNKLNLKVSTPSEWKGTSLTYEIIKKEKNKMTLSMIGFTAYLVKVSDNTIEKYLK